MQVIYVFRPAFDVLTEDEIYALPRSVTILAHNYLEAAREFEDYGVDITKMRHTVVDPASPTARLVHFDFDY